MSKYLSLSRVIDILKDKLDDPLFCFDDLKSCLKKGELELLVKLDSPSVLYISSNDPDCLFNPDRVYKLESKIFAKPLGFFDIESLVPEEFQFNWKNTIYKLWSCSDKYWVIKKTDLDDFFNLPPKEPDWVALCSGTVATHLVEIWEYRWKNVKKDIPNVKLLIKTLKENSTAKEFKNYKLGEHDSLIHKLDNESGWVTSKLKQSWNSVIDKYNNQK